MSSSLSYKDEMIVDRRDGSSAGLTAEGSHPVRSEICDAISNALIFLRINSNGAEHVRPFHSA
jgi:hypothetical protein